MHTVPTNKPVVLHIVYSGLGGIANVFFSLVEAAKHDNYQHAVAFYGDESLLEDYRIHCEILGVEQRYFKRSSRIDLKVNRDLTAWIKELAPAAIIVNLPRALQAAIDYKKTNPSVKIIGVEHNATALKRWIDWRDSARLNKYCTDVIYLTNSYKNDVSYRLGKYFDSTKASIIPNGINTDKFKPVEGYDKNSTSISSSTSNKTKRVIRIGMASRLTVTKDIITLIRSMKELTIKSNNSRVVLSIAGDGPDSKNLKSEVHSLNLESHVDFLGFLTEEELISWFQSLDIYAHASLAETMSTAVIQGLSTGLPCVVSNLPGMSEIVIPSTGFLAEPRNVSELTSALSKLVSDDKLRLSMGNNARKHALGNFSQLVAWQRYKHIIDATN